MNFARRSPPSGLTPTVVGSGCYGFLASEPEPEGGGEMQVTTVERVSVSLNHDAGEGWMYIHPSASTSEIRAALDQVDSAGFEELDTTETGDEPEFDDLG